MRREIITAIAFILYFTNIAFSADYILNSTANGSTVNTCSGNFYDSGGSSSNYTNNQNYTMTFCADNGGEIIFNFSGFRIESGYDYLYVYDGTSDSSPAVSGSPFTGQQLLGSTIQSTNGCLTFKIITDYSTTRSGWAAAISCTSPPIPGTTSFLWYDGSSGQVWNATDTEKSYKLPFSDGATTQELGVTMKIIDTDNRNGDPDLHDTHPFDTGSGCLPYPGSTGDTVSGDGSITDPWDSDCDPLFTETDGGYGLSYLTFGIKTEDHLEEVTIEYTFSRPVFLENYTVSDIDYTGLRYDLATLDAYERPGNSFQDEVVFSASGLSGNVPITFKQIGSGLTQNGQSIISDYDINLNGNLSPDNLAGTVQVSTNSPITKLSITYKNGIDDANAEQNNASDYNWWSASNGATNGVSDDQGVRISGFNVRVDLTLPVELENFHAIQKNCKSLLRWETVSEIDNDYFLIEHSIDGSNFSSIGKVDGAGTSTKRNWYSYILENEKESWGYYRLKQVDYDGAFEYSEVITLSNCRTYKVNVFPNPVIDKLNIKLAHYDDLSDTFVNILIYNALGHLVLQEVKNIAELSAINVDNLVDGLYTLVINSESNNNIITQKIVKRNF